MKILSYVIGYLCLLPLYSCSSGDGTLNGDDLGLFNSNGNRLSDNYVYFDYEGGTEDVYAYNVKNMSINTIYSSFITVNSYYNSSFTIEVEPNYSDEERMAEIMFDMGTSHEFLVVLQESCKIAVKTKPASDITIVSAVLNGTLSGVNQTVEVGFYYGTESYSLNNKKTMKLSTSGNFTATLSGLSQSTNYYFRAYVIVNGKQFDGSIQQFTTATPGVSEGSDFDKEDFDPDIKI